MPFIINVVFKDLPRKVLLPKMTLYVQFLARKLLQNLQTGLQIRNERGRSDGFDIFLH